MNRLTGVTEEQHFIISLSHLYKVDSMERLCTEKLFSILRSHKSLRFRHKKINEEKKFYQHLIDFHCEKLEIDHTWENCINLCMLVQAHLNNNLPVHAERLRNGDLQITIVDGKKEEVLYNADKYGEEGAFKALLHLFNYSVADYWVQDGNKQTFVIVFDLTLNESGEMKNCNGQWSFERFREIRPIEELLEKGKVIFKKVEE